MRTTVYFPEFIKEPVEAFLESVGHTLEELIETHNRPYDIACVERKFGHLLSDQLVTVTSREAYMALGVPPMQMGCYFQIGPDGRGIVVIDVDLLDTIDERDVRIAMQLVTLCANGELSVHGSNFTDVVFNYNGSEVPFQEIVSKIQTIVESHPDMLDDQRIIEALGKYIQPWYRDAAIMVANDTGSMDPGYELVKDLVA